VTVVADAARGDCETTRADGNDSLRAEEGLDCEPTKRRRRAKAGRKAQALIHAPDLRKFGGAEVGEVFVHAGVLVVL
jgi:hypothetical protein